MNQQNQQQEQIQALMVQAQWFQAVMIGLAAASAAMLFLPKIVAAVKEKKG